MKNTLIILLTLTTTCIVQSAQAQMPAKKSTVVNCSTWDCLVKNKNTKANAEGVFRKYTPNKKGKGANHMFWDWELLLSDSNAVPVSISNKNIDYKSFEGKKVIITGLIYYGIVIGSSNPNEQSATGYRLDPVEIRKSK